MTNLKYLEQEANKKKITEERKTQIEYLKKKNILTK